MYSGSLCRNELLYKIHIHQQRHGRNLTHMSENPYIHRTGLPVLSNLADARTASRTGSQAASTPIMDSGCFLMPDTFSLWYICVMWKVKLDDNLWLAKGAVTTKEEAEAWLLPDMPAVQKQLKKIRRHRPYKDAMVIAEFNSLEWTPPESVVSLYLKSDRIIPLCD